MKRALSVLSVVYMSILDTIVKATIGLDAIPLIQGAMIRQPIKPMPLTLESIDLVMIADSICSV